MDDAALTRKLSQMGFYLYFLSFCEGFLSAHPLLIFLFYMKDCNMPIERFTVLDLCGSFVALTNPLYGGLTDNFPLLGYHKKSYLAAVALLSTAGYAYLATLPTARYDYNVFLAMHLYMEVLNQFRTVLINSYCAMAYRYTERVESKEEGGINKRTVSHRQTSMHSGRLLSMVLVPFYPYVLNKFFLVMGLCTLAVCGAALLMHEVITPVVKGENRVIAQVTQCFKVLRRERLWPMLLSNFVILSAPFIEGVIKGYLNKVHHFTETLYTVRSLISRLTMMYAIYTIQRYFKDFDRAVFNKASSMLYALMVLTFYFTVLFGVRDHALLVPLVMLFAVAHSYFSELKKISYFAIVVEKSPPNSQGLFSTIMFYMENSAIIVSKYLTKLIVKHFQMDKTNYRRMDTFLLMHVGMGVVGNLMLMLSPIPAKKKASPDVPEAESVDDTLPVEPAQIAVAGEPSANALQTVAHIEKLASPLQAETLSPDAPNDYLVAPIPLGNLHQLPGSPSIERFKNVN